MALSLLGCSPPPDEVNTTASPTGETATSTGGSGPTSGTTLDGSATAVASADGTGSTSSGSTMGPATTMPLDGTTTVVDPSTTSGSSGAPGSSSGMGSMEGGNTTGNVGDCHPLLAEVLYDPMGGNGGKQWIKLYNPCDQDIDLQGASLGWGGTSYAAQGADLEGTIMAGECYLIGGPTVSADTYNPVYDLVLDFSADLEVSGNDADGIALFDDIEANIGVATIPVDAVIYGPVNTSDLLDSNGDTPAPHVGDAASTQSIRRTALGPTWIIEPNPMPNACPAL